MENTEIWKTYREKTKYNSKIEISNFGNVREDNNGEICKMIKPEDLQTYLDKGWICGRIYRRNTCHS